MAKSVRPWGSIPATSRVHEICEVNIANLWSTNISWAGGIHTLAWKWTVRETRVYSQGEMKSCTVVGRGLVCRPLRMCYEDVGESTPVNFELLIEPLSSPNTRWAGVLNTVELKRVCDLHWVTEPSVRNMLPIFVKTVSRKCAVMVSQTGMESTKLITNLLAALLVSLSLQLVWAERE